MHTYKGLELKTLLFVSCKKFMNAYMDSQTKQSTRTRLKQFFHKKKKNGRIKTYVLEGIGTSSSFSGFRGFANDTSTTPEQPLIGAYIKSHKHL